MIFSIDEGIFRLFPSLKIGVLVGEIDNTRYGNDHLEEVIDDVKIHFSFERPQDHPNIKVWEEAFKKLETSTLKYQSFIESLLEKTLKGGPFQRVNPLVDLCNAVSLRRLVPIGCHALNLIDGDISLCFAEGREIFTPMHFGEQEIVEKGEVIYKDSKDVLTRKWVWRQCYKGKVLDETTRVFITVDIMEGLPDWLCESTINNMEDGIITNGYGKITCKDILTKNKLQTEFE